MICVKAQDGDLDPVSFEWTQVSGPPVLVGPQVVATTPQCADGSVRQCVRFGFDRPGDYAFDVRVYDMMTGEQGGQIRIEDYLISKGQQSVKSHDEVQVPIRVADAIYFPPVPECQIGCRDEPH